MFESVGEARAAFARELSPDDVELALAALTPTIAFREGAARPGGSRLGGLPELPRGQGWPIRKRLANLEAVKARGGSAHSEHIDRFGGVDLPLPFYAQLDCAEMHRTAADVAGPLPTKGRLLFFYDEWCGPWGDDDVSACVVHDTSAVADLVAVQPPEALLAVQTSAQAEWRAAMIDAKLDPAAYSAPSFICPARPVVARRTLAALSYMAHDMELHPELKARLDDDDVHEAYTAFSEWHGGLFEGPGGGMRLHRVMGPPVAVQRDPRIHGVLTDDATRWSDPGWSDPRWRAELAKAALDWRVLLQVDLADLKQDQLVEGVVYFIIASSALAAGDFSGVRAVYQQT